jgi:hypothetical protein
MNVKSISMESDINKVIPSALVIFQWQPYQRNTKQTLWSESFASHWTSLQEAAALVDDRNDDASED